MYTFITNPANYQRRSSPSGAFTFIVLLSYATISLNASAAISSFIVADSLSEIPFRKATFDEDPYPEMATVRANQTYLLSKYGAGKMWQSIVWHCKSTVYRRDLQLTQFLGLFCYLAGIWCLILQIMTYALMQEPDEVRIPITCVTGFAVFPLTVYVIPSVMSRSHAQSS